MKKIMFNDKFGLTKAVLEGRKTQTRRIAYDFRKKTRYEVTKSVILPSGSITYMDGKVQVLDDMPQPLYKVGEHVAIAQSYDDIYMEKNAPCPIPEEYRLNAFDKGFNRGHKGWHNKMYVSADDMPFQIKITNVRVERLQDISEEDCLKEGIIQSYNYYQHRHLYGCSDGNKKIKIATGAKMDLGYATAQEVFSYLIDKTCGRGTWHSNPYVFVYDFELIK